MKNEMITASKNEISNAFESWEREYRKNPELFISEATKLLKTTPKSYGESCCVYFCAMLEKAKRKARKAVK